MPNLTEAQGDNRIQEAWEVAIRVRGDCGRLHPTFEDWQRCPTCDAIIRRNYTAARCF